MENTMTKQKAQKIVKHMRAALELDPDCEVIKTTNAARMEFGINMIEKRIARGDFPMISKLRERFGIKPLTTEESNEQSGKPGSDE